MQKSGFFEIRRKRRKRNPSPLHGKTGKFLKIGAEWSSWIFPAAGSRQSVTGPSVIFSGASDTVLQSILIQSVHNAPILHFKALFRRFVPLKVKCTREYYTRLKTHARHLKIDMTFFIPFWLTGIIPAQYP